MDNFSSFDSVADDESYVENNFLLRIRLFPLFRQFHSDRNYILSSPTFKFAGVVFGQGLHEFAADVCGRKSQNEA